MAMERLKWILVGAAVGSFGCATQDSEENAQVTALGQAVSLIECQTEAAECLGALPDATGILECQEHFSGCIVDSGLEVIDDTVELTETVGEAGANVVSASVDTTVEVTSGIADAGTEVVGTAVDTAADTATTLAEAGADAVSATADATRTAADLGLGVVGGAVDLTGCQAQGIACVGLAGTFGDATDCRAEFEACVGGAFDLPEIDPPTLAPPTLPMPRADSPQSAMDLVSGVNDCQAVAESCSQAAATDLSAVADCADSYRSCVSDALSGTASEEEEEEEEEEEDAAAEDDSSNDEAADDEAATPPAMDNGDESAEDEDDSDWEQNDRASCELDVTGCALSAVDVDEVRECAATFADCASLPSLGLLDDVDDPNLLLEVVHGLPTPTGVVVGQICLADLALCVTLGDDASECADEAQECADL